MRIVTFTRRNSAQPRVGAILPGGREIIDFFAALEVSENQFGSPFALLEWFDLDGTLFQRAASLYKKIIGGSGGEYELPKSAIIGSDETRLLAPVPRPGKLICVGLNYRDHAAESKMAVPESPIIFSKFSTSVIGNNQPIILPAASEKTDYEAELAVVVGRRTSGIVRREAAFDYVFGYTNLNDVSERGYQFSDGQWQRGKSCDTFAPMGPFIATTDEIPDPHRLGVRLRLNGKTMQDSDTSRLIFDIPELIEFLSETITLEPGDVVATGTPPGVGFARNPPVFLTDGDLVEVEVEGLGVLSNPVSAKSGRSQSAESF